MHNPEECVVLHVQSSSLGQLSWWPPVEQTASRCSWWIRFRARYALWHRLMFVCIYSMCSRRNWEDQWLNFVSWIFKNPELNQDGLLRIRSAVGSSSQAVPIRAPRWLLIESPWLRWLVGLGSSMKISRHFSSSSRLGSSGDLLGPFFFLEARQL